MFKLTCDIAACGAEIQSGRGQPTLSGKRDLYCPRCASYIAGVDREIESIANTKMFALTEELDALRKQKIAEALPAQSGGVGMKADWVIEAANDG